MVHMWRGKNERQLKNTQHWTYVHSSFNYFRGLAGTTERAAGHPPLTEDVRQPGHVDLDDLPAGDHGVVVPGASCGRDS